MWDRPVGELRYRPSWPCSLPMSPITQLPGAEVRGVIGTLEGQCSR